MWALGLLELTQREKGLFYGDDAPVSLPRARSEQSISKVRGASGDEDPLVRFSRETLSLVTSQATERRRLTDEALCEEASRYVDPRSFPMGVRELSSSTPSVFGRVVLNEGSFGGLASVVNEEEQIPLRIILADGSNGELVSKGEKFVASESVGGEF